MISEKVTEVETVYSRPSRLMGRLLHTLAIGKTPASLRIPNALKESDLLGFKKGLANSSATPPKKQEWILLEFPQNSQDRSIAKGRVS